MLRLRKEQLFCAFVLLGLASVAPAQQPYEHRSCYTGPHHVISNTDKVMGGGYELSGMVLAEPNDPLHNASGVCIGAWTSVEGQYQENGSCQYTLPSGDRIFGVYSRRNQDPGEWKVVSATGKMKGLVHSGNWLHFTAFAQSPGQYSACGKEWGTFKLVQ